MTSKRRETIHISLGSTANSITSHLLNLQGLAATSDEFDADITHTVYQQTRVPRVLMIDEPHQFSRQVQQGPLPTVSTWSGQVEIQREESASTTRSVLESLKEAAASLAYSEHSRYRVKQNVTRYDSLDNGRHVNWDNLQDDDGDHETEEEGVRRQQQEQQQWIQSTKEPMEQQMDSIWQQKDTLDTEEILPWFHYFMPPYQPLFSSPLPFAQGSHVEETWDTFQKGATELKNWKETLMLERLRHLLEDCDSLQGVVLVTEGCGIYSGLATALLQELQEDCKTAGRLVINVVDPPESESSDEGWHPAHVRLVRRNIQTGLALHGLATNCHALLPLSIGKHKSMFHASTQLAIGLETATLPYRINGKGSQIGLAGGYFGGSGFASAGYGTSEQLSFGEYLASLQPSPRYKIFELDLCTETIDLANMLMEGTSLERDHRMRLQGRDAYVRRPRDVLPGGWLEADSLVSYSPKAIGKRSFHHHFGLAGLMRPSSKSSNIPDYLTCTMESIGIRYRPEVSMGTVASTSICQLVAGGYGAGSYWKKTLSPETPVLTVLSNSTRSYSYLSTVARNMKQGLSRKFNGYHNRDVMQNILPEAEDCKEAMEHSLDLRDIYHPPDGSGLGVDEEGTYFDDGS